MFDIGFGELLLIAVVALIVLGPERLPKAARFAGLWVRRARAQWYSVKAELERELAAEEIKRGAQETRSAFDQAQARVREEFGQAKATLDEGVASATRQVDDLRREVEDLPPGSGGDPEPLPGPSPEPSPETEGNDGPRQP